MSLTNRIAKGIIKGMVRIIFIAFISLLANYKTTELHPSYGVFVVFIILSIIIFGWD